MKIFTIIIFCLVLISSVTAMEISFFYADSCPYCQRIKPLIMNYVNSDDNTWNLYETSSITNKELYYSYGFEGVPAFVIKTDDGRQIEFVGADERRLKCELNEMTTKECPTYSINNCIGGSWFIS